MNYFKNKDKFFLIIILLSLLSLYNSSDCSQCDTPSSTNKECSSQPECKWFQIDTTTYKLLECEGISNSENKYYTKEISRDGQYYCRLLGINGFPNKKIIDGTTQIIKSCQDLGLYELGDKCFHSIPNNAEVSNTNTKEFKCKYKNYIKNQDKGLNYYICLNENEDCPNEFKYYDQEKKNVYIFVLLIRKEYQ